MFWDMGSKEKFSGQGEPERLPYESQSGSDRPVIRPDGSVDKQQLRKGIRRRYSDPSLLPPNPGKFSVLAPIDVDKLSDDGKKLLEVLDRGAGTKEHLPSNRVCSPWMMRFIHRWILTKRR